MPLGYLMPTVGRTIHWHIAGSDLQSPCMIVHVTALEYGPHVDSPAILGMEYGDDAHVIRLPLTAGDWHFSHDHDGWMQTAPRA